MKLELVRGRARKLSNDTPLSIEFKIGFYFFCTINSLCFLGVLTLVCNVSYIAAEQNLGAVF
jgi:hypothetical protein